MILTEQIGVNHLALMIQAFYNFLCISYTIDGITFSLLDVCKFSLGFSIIAFALYQYVGKHCK